MKTIGVLLAAGKSTRFGTNNKLLEDFKGRSLCTYAAEAMAGAGLSGCVAVVSDSAVAMILPEFEPVYCSGNQSDSLKTGVHAAIALDADQIVVCLADMPFITVQLIVSLMSLAKDHPICGSTWGGKKSPPAVIPKAKFDEVLKLQGDSGAFSLLRNLPASAFLAVGEIDLIDLDTVGDFRIFCSNSWNSNFS
ncbi:MAG: nucleotidyltransferase family protein [Octadecabacter sp.]|nr:nucleotidyltransferase family protein [Octadecabacter sp.]